MKTKIILLSLCLTLTDIALAIPVLNENRASSGNIVIYPDHSDPTHFYIAPSVVTIAKDENGRPNFTYTEVRKNLFQKSGILQMTLTAAYTQKDLDLAKSKILEKIPAAYFSGLPFIQSSLQLTGELKALIEDNQCDHPAGVVGQEESCTLVLTPKGRNVYLDSVQNQTMFTTLQFEYSVQGVILEADGKYQDEVIKHSIAARISNP